MITQPGKYPLTNEEYHADNLCEVPTLSRGTIKRLVLGCPAKAWVNHPRLNPNFKPEEKDAFDLGKAAHALFLEGLDNAMVFNFPNWKTNEAKDAKSEARKMGKTPLLVDQYTNIKAMVEVANEELRKELGLSITEGESEGSYIWNEGETWMKIRPDWIGQIILDYKTTGASSNPEDYSNIAGNTGLDIQDAFYRRGIYAVSREEKPFIFMVQETEAPYICSFIELDSLFKEMGEQKVHKGINLWKQCMKSGIWPGYTRGIYTLEPKPWTLSSWEQRQASL